MSSWQPLDPYRGQETEALTGAALAELVAFYKRTADQNHEPHDPQWDQWLADDRAGTTPPVDNR